ncbi:MAG TPA: gliding motility-associated C-terminal domain-containing protein [Ferruginibacter sp.]|nr:gliding motility-associated C-terminal domain-containing protein [Ferruginibacter sp.]
MSCKFLTILFFSSFLLLQFSYAQLCQGSLGDPIVNTNFGNGANPGAPLLSATTNYQYVAGDCPNDGFYTVRNNTNACFSNSWHSISSDHTGDAGGYFMLVNASIQPSAFYLDTVRGLCGNTTYEFAAWIINVLLPSSCNGSGNQPNLTFSIERTDGTVLQSYNSGNISSTASPTWKQYGFFFTTPPAGADIVLRIINNAAGGCGNDLALDDITFRPCGPLLTPGIVGHPTTTVSLCEGIGGSYTFNVAVSGGFTNPVFMWQSRLNNGAWYDVPVTNLNTLNVILITTAPPGSYQFRLVVAEAGNMVSPQCRIASQLFTLMVNAKPVTTATNDGPKCEGSTITLTANGGSQYAWTGPNGFTGTGSPLLINNLQLNQAGKYYVTVSNAAGCSRLDSTIIVVNPAPVATTVFSNASICEKDSVQLSAAGGMSYQWIPATGLSNPNVFDPKASPGSTTVYSVIASNTFSCRDTATVTINVVNKPVADAGADKVILRGQSVQLSGAVSGNGNTFSWSPPTNINDIYSLQPMVNPPADARYILSAVSNFGCGTSADTMFVKVYNGIFIPNAFTPNADRLNDTWNIPALSAYPTFELFVYGRWGQLVFYTKDKPMPWDGTYKNSPCPNGAYTYIIKTGNDVLKGNVLIIR